MLPFALLCSQQLKVHANLKKELCRYTKARHDRNVGLQKYLWSNVIPLGSNLTLLQYPLR